MDIASILVVTALTILVVGYIVRPLVRDEGLVLSQAERRYSALEAERERILAAVQEMDLDHALGKNPSQDYETQRAALVSQGASILKEIDDLDYSEAAPVEAAVRDQARTSVKGLETEIEAAVARLRERAAERVGFCAQCGEPVLADDNFCSRCGAPVQVEPETRA